MKKHMRWVLAASLTLAAPAVWATYHTFQIDEIFSNADGTIQYVVLHETEGMDGQNRLAGRALTATQGTTRTQYFFQDDLPGSVCDSYGCSMLSPTAHAHVLIATQGFAALGLVTPDYVIPNGFIPLVNGTLDYAGADLLFYAALPTDGVTALKRTGALIPNVATNFAAKSASVNAPGSVNYQGLWWKAPGASEDGWGINFAHQGNVIFGTWFTYDTTGKGWWLTLITDSNPSPGSFTAKLYATTGPPFNAVPFVKTGAAPPPIGTATLTFTDANNGSFHYDVTLPTGTVSQTKAITRQLLGNAPMATCATSVQSLAAATNYQDIWWAGTSANPGTEQGWGINFAQQGGTVFASWFTYDLDGTPLWLVATLAPGVPGNLYRPSGPRFDAYDKNQFEANAPVGTMTVTFADGNNAAFNYTVQLAGMTTPVTQTKNITRQLFSAAGTVCK